MFTESVKCRSLIVFLVCLIWSLPLSASQLRGVVRDQSTNELLTGAYIESVHLATGERSQAVTGLDGTFILKNLKDGSHHLSISFLGYQTFEQDVMVDNATAAAVREFTLALSNQLLGEVQVVGNTQGTDVQARNLEREAPTVLNVVSAKQILLSPDITVANVIQRVSGLSIERNASGDPQYAIIRGMDKRYNNTLINGIKIPSPDSENRFVPLDIFPAVFLERLEVYKSLTANMEADAIGGTVNMVMKNAPATKIFDADFQVGYNEINFEGEFLTYSREELNLISPKEEFGDSYRATPDDFPTGNMVQSAVRPRPDVFANLTYGDRFADGRLGLMVGASFQNSFRPVDNFFYDPAVNRAPGNPLIMRELIVRQTSSEFLRMALHTRLDYQLNRTKLNLYLGAYQLNEYRVRDQYRRETFVNDNLYAVYPVVRFSNILQTIATADLGAEHKLTERATIDARVVYSVAVNNRPDDGVFATTGTFDSTRDTVINEQVYFQGTRNSRAWQENFDGDLSGYLNLRFKPEFLEKQKGEVQVGGLYRTRTRDNSYNYYNYTQIIGQQRGIHWTDFSNVNFISMANPLGSGDRSNLVYDASEQVIAGYVNTIFTLGKANVTAGVRVESTQQGYEIDEPSANPETETLEDTQQYTDLFPSVSIKYALAPKQFLKATYFKGISRPGFYEIVPIVRSQGGGDSFYSEQGNPDLRPSIGHSADVRWEFFPNGLDQILAGVFFKRILNPIEYGFPQVSGTDQEPSLNRLLPQNFADATNYGVEFDYLRYFNNFGIRANYTYTQSSITTSKIVLNPVGAETPRTLVNQTRPLQGQSNHIANLSLLYKHAKAGLDIQLVGNYTGERIAVVSPYLDADQYMRPMTQLDFSIEKEVGKKRFWVVFVKVNNILDTPYELYVKKPLFDPDGAYPYQEGMPADEALIRRDLYGRSYRVGVRFNFRSES